MSEMGERAAKAICETLFGPYDGGEADRSDASISGQSRAAARAAIEAMRKPTQAMINAVDLSVPTEGMITDIWGTMIEAALK